MSIFSCAKQELFNPSDIQTNSNSINTRHGKYFSSEREAMMYVESGLLEYADAFMRLANNETFKEILYSQILSKFDDDYNILVKDLVLECEEQGFYIEDTLAAKNPNFEFEDLYDIFMDIEGSYNYYAQIHIPNFDSLQYLNRDVVAAVYYGDESLELYTAYDMVSKLSGYEIDSVGTLDEQYVDENEVWVFSINETVDNDGQVPSDEDVPNDYPEAPEDSIEFRSTVSFQIDKITIKDRFEGFLGGKSEIHVRASLEYYDGLNPLNGIATSFVSDRTSSDYKGYRILKIRKKDIGDEFDVDYNMQQGWLDEDFFDDPVVYQFIIFEYDSWPASVKVDEVAVPEGIAKVYQYRSQQDNFYFLGTVFSTIPSPAQYSSSVYPNGIPSGLHADGFTFSSDDIQFNTEYY